VNRVDDARRAETSSRQPPQPRQTESVLASTPSDWYWLLDGHEKVFSRTEAKESGVSYPTVRRRLKTGKWRRIDRGVYATFTGPLTREARLWAIAGRAGKDAMFSHETAAELHGISDKPSSTIHVTVPHSRRLAQKTPWPGIQIHRSDQSAAESPNTLKLPRTTVADTVLDVVATAKTLDYGYSIISRALWKHKVTAEALLERLETRTRYARRAWFRDAVADASDGAHFPLERLYLREVERRHGLPKAHRQALGRLPSGKQYKDNLYEDYKVCVELDGAAYHSNEQALADRRRDNQNLAADDVRTFRFGFVDVTVRPCECAEIVVAGLRRGGWTGTPRSCGHPDCRVDASHS
jgi:predicted transcriptional regulator of viral defense system